MDQPRSSDWLPGSWQSSDRPAGDGSEHVGDGAEAPDTSGGAPAAGSSPASSGTAASSPAPLGGADSARSVSDPAGTQAAGTHAADPQAADPDAATPDAATPDAATPDAATPEAASPDAATPDAATPDAATHAASPDAGQPSGAPAPAPAPAQPVAAAPSAEAAETQVLADPSGGSEPAAWPPPAAGWPPPSAPAQPPTQQPARSRTGLLIAGAAVVALLAGGVGGAVGYQLAGGDSTSSLTAAPEGGGDISPPAEGSIAAIAAAVTPAVVSISAGAGSGSGFVITSDGYIVTNNHVIEGADEISVGFSDGSLVRAELVGANADYDLAVLNVNERDLPVAALGSSEAVLVGDTAIAVGSPLGLSGTVTSGIVSALDRPVTAGDRDETSFINAIQTDAAINPGNSGGPLLNANGEVIGVNSAIATLGAGLGGQGGSIGLGFAIPIDITKRIADEIIRTGSAQTPGIGVTIEDTDNGVQVVDVTGGGPADDAGIESGDVITEVSGEPVSGTTELIVAIRDNAVGDTVTLTVERNGRERSVDVTLGAL